MPSQERLLNAFSHSFFLPCSHFVQSASLSAESATNAGIRTSPLSFYSRPGRLFYTSFVGNRFFSPIVVLFVATPLARQS